MQKYNIYPRRTSFVTNIFGSLHPYEVYQPSSILVLNKITSNFLIFHHNLYLEIIASSHSCFFYKRDSLEALTEPYDIKKVQRFVYIIKKY